VMPPQHSSKNRRQRPGTRRGRRCHGNGRDARTAARRGDGFERWYPGTKARDSEASRASRVALAPARANLFGLAHGRHRSGFRSTSICATPDGA
jgi:hypothetical protein